MEYLLGADVAHPLTTTRSQDGPGPCPVKCQVPISLVISDYGLSSMRRTESTLSLGHFGSILHLTPDSDTHWRAA